MNFYDFCKGIMVMVTVKLLPADCVMSVLFLRMTETLGQGQRGHDLCRCRRLQVDKLSRNVMTAAYKYIKNKC